MLVLTRKTGELIVIGDDIKIKIVEIKGRQVRLGIEAPRNVEVNREEIHRQKNADKGGVFSDDKTGTYDE